MRPFLLVSILLPLVASPLQVADLPPFPPITDEERALASVPGDPNAPAVVLFKKGEFLMMGYGPAGGSRESHLRVQARVKILTEAGKHEGDVVVAHSGFTKLERFEGRTVLPDGRVVAVPPEARFVRRTSQAGKTFVTAVAFPSLAVGAILDYQYELVFKSPLLLDPWYFAEELPVRHSEIVFRIAPGWEMRPWSRAPFGARIQQERESTPEGDVLRAWAANLPAVPEDPYGPPYGDLATQMMLMPTALTAGPLVLQRLADNWASVSVWVGGAYEEARRRDSGVAQQARRIAASAAPRQQAEALFRFVRDEIETQPEPGIFVDPEASLRKILGERRGTPAEKALLLQAMLKAVRIESGLVWAGDRNRGQIDFQVPNPVWFDTVLVVLDFDGQHTFLDPSDRALAFGQLRPGYEGTTALICRIGAPWQVRLPEASYDQNRRHAEIDLDLDARGCLAGRGFLRLTGNRAWEKIDGQEGEVQTAQAWKEWLAERFRGFQVADVKALQTPDERQVVVTWSMSQREEEVLGDEASLAPSAPLGPVTQPLVQPSTSRKTMVMFDFVNQDEVELRLRWPEGWKIESLPAPVVIANEVGAVAVSIERKDGERSLLYRRRFDIFRRVLRRPQEYEEAQLLFAAAEKSDAQAVLLVGGVD